MDLIVVDPVLKTSSFYENLGPASPRELERFARQARRAAGLRGEVHVLITSSSRVRALNRRFRKKDKPTDVLSFPSAVEGTHGGDIAISAEIAGQQAHSLGHSLAAELKVLMLHGMLHLAGYDHERDSGQMARKEERLRRALGLTSGLIERGLIQRAGGAKRSGRLQRAAPRKRKC